MVLPPLMRSRMPTSSSVKDSRMRSFRFRSSLSAILTRPSRSTSCCSRLSDTNMARTGPCWGRSANSPIAPRAITSRMTPRIVRPGSSLRPWSDSNGMDDDKKPKRMISRLSQEQFKNQEKFDFKIQEKMNSSFKRRNQEDFTREVLKRFFKKQT